MTASLHYACEIRKSGIREPTQASSVHSTASVFAERVMIEYCPGVVSLPRICPHLSCSSPRKRVTPKKRLGRKNKKATFQKYCTWGF